MASHTDVVKHRMINQENMLQEQQMSRLGAKTAMPNAKGSSGVNPGATSAQTTFNLVKNIVGAGVLSLPSGVAAGTGVVPAVLITIALGLYSGWTFSKLGEMCAHNDALTFRDLGEKTKGRGFAKIMTLTCTIKTFFTCLVFSLVISDSWSAILLTCGVHLSREMVLVGMTLFVLLPLCSMQDLSILSYTSLLGSGGLVYTVVFMTVRMFDGSYLPGGHFHDTVAPYLHPNFADAPGWFTVDAWQTLTLVSLLSTAFIAHYNAPKFYEQLANRSPGRFSWISGVSFSIAIVFFLAFMVVGYLTFGTNSQGLILNNYSSSDMPATIARTAIGSSVVLTYPLAFTGLRDGVGAFVGSVNPRVLTITLLAMITGIALRVTDIGFVNALQGAILGSTIIYCFPGLIMVFHAQKANGRIGGTYILGLFTASAGIVLAVTGTILTVVKQFYPELLLAHTGAHPALVQLSPIVIHEVPYLNQL